MNRRGIYNEEKSARGVKGLQGLGDRAMGEGE
jgi:hypothetical protein